MKLFTRSAFLAATALVILTACTPATDISVFSSTRPAFEGEMVVFTDRGRLPAGYVEIGLIVVRDRGATTTISEQDLLDALKVAAASIGANAVLLSRETQSGGGTIIGSTYIASNERVLIGLALWLE